MWTCRSSEDTRLCSELNRLPLKFHLLVVLVVQQVAVSAVAALGSPSVDNLLPSGSLATNVAVVASTVVLRVVGVVAL